MTSPPECSSSSAEGASPSSNQSWWRWRWRPSAVVGMDEKSVVIPPTPSTPLEGRREGKPPIHQEEMSVWDRIRDLCEKPSMERDAVISAARMSFFGGFLVGGASGYQLVKQQYETTNKGKNYLSPSDAIKRKLDYAIVRFAMKGFKMGMAAGCISGSIVLLTTQTAAYRGHFSALYFPAFSGPLAVLLHSGPLLSPLPSLPLLAPKLSFPSLSVEREDNLGVDGSLTRSALVGGVFAFPTGLIGVAKSFGLGITSGLTLSAVCGLYALSTDRSIDSAYWHLKREYESGIKEEGAFEKRVKEVMAEQNVWRYQAVRVVEEEKDNQMKMLDA